MYKNDGASPNVRRQVTQFLKPAIPQIGGLVVEVHRLVTTPSPPLYLLKVLRNCVDECYQILTECLL
jgi:hypothetical protein